jgi:hypothetical protein
MTVSSNCSLGLTNQVMRMVMLKGSGLADMQYQIYALLAFAVSFDGWAILNYKKRAGSEIANER